MRKVGNQETIKDLWNKLEQLYTETSLPSKLFLLENFFRYKLDLSKKIEENIDDFTKLIQDIKLISVKNISDYSPIILLNVISETYSDVKDAIEYGRDNVNLESVISGLKSNEMDLKTNIVNQVQNEINHVRKRTKYRNFENKYKNRSHSRSKFGDKNEKSWDRRCYNCDKEGHFNKNYKMQKRNGKNEEDAREVF